MALESKAHRKYFFDNAKYIQEKTPGSLMKVIIDRDFTTVQRDERRVKFAKRQYFLLTSFVISYRVTD